MIKVNRVVPISIPDVVITLDNEAAQAITKWLGETDTPSGPVSWLWDALDDVVYLEIAESIKGIR